MHDEHLVFRPSCWSSRVAIFVGAFIINNTFSITVAPRTKEMAMLRSIGARPADGRCGPVILEAGVVVALASWLGPLVGIGVAAGLEALDARLGGQAFPSDGPMVGRCQRHRPSLVVGIVVITGRRPRCRGSGVGGRADRCAPRRGARSVGGSAPAVDRRFGLGRCGRRGLALGRAQRSAGPGRGLGALVVFVGVSVLGPVLASPVAYVVGTVRDPDCGCMVSAVAGRATRCATPNGRRTASSLMIGVGLVGVHHHLRRLGEDLVAGFVGPRLLGTHIVHSGCFDNSAGISPDLAGDLRRHSAVSTTVSRARLVQADVGGTLADSVLRPSISTTIGDGVRHSVGSTGDLR